MGATGGLQSAGYGIQGLASIGGAVAESNAMRAQGAYQAGIASTNAGFARMQAKDTTERGDFQASQTQVRARGIQGAQRASFAAQGVDVGTGSAANIQSETGTLGALDALTIKNNAWLQSWGYQQQAQEETAKGRFQQMAANNQAGQTLLTGGMNAVSFGMKGMGAYWASQKQDDEEWGLTGMGNK